MNRRITLADDGDLFFHTFYDVHFPSSFTHNSVCFAAAALRAPRITHVRSGPSRIRYRFFSMKIARQLQAFAQVQARACLAKTKCPLRGRLVSFLLPLENHAASQHPRSALPDFLVVRSGESKCPLRGRLLSFLATKHLCGDRTGVVIYMLFMISGGCLRCTCLLFVSASIQEEYTGSDTCHAQKEHQ